MAIDDGGYYDCIATGKTGEKSQTIVYFVTVLRTFLTYLFTYLARFVYCLAYGFGLYDMMVWGYVVFRL